MRRVASSLLAFALAGLAGSAVRADAERVHEVQAGETLWQIAAGLTGDPYRWPELYRANRDQIRDPSTLYPGQRLAIPDFDATPRLAPSVANGAAAQDTAQGRRP